MTPAPATHADPRAAILATIAGMAAFGVSDACMKLASAHHPVGQTIALRGVFASLMMTALALSLGALHLHRGLLAPPFLLRTAGEIGASVFLFLALARMPIAEATAILQFLPLALTAASAVVLREAVGWRRWSATLVGLAGVLLIVRPGTPNFGGPSLLMLACVASVTVRDLSTRRISGAIPSMTVAWATTIAVMASGAALDPPAVWTTPGPGTWGLLAISGVGVLIGNLMIITSVRAAPVSVLAPFRYTSVLFALISGFLVWREVPDSLTLAGIAIVIAAGLYTFHRERVAAKGRGATSASHPAAG